MSALTDSLLANPLFRSAIATDESLRDIAQRFGCSFGFAQRLRSSGVFEDAAVLPVAVPVLKMEAKGAPEYSRDEDSAGITITKVADRIIPLSEWLLDLAADGYDPDDFNTSHGHSIWTQHTKDQVTKTLYSNRFSAVRKVRKDDSERLVSTEVVLEAIRSFTYIPQPVAYQDESFVLVPTDFQFGKVDWNGGSKETAAQVMESFSKAAAFVKEFRPREVAILDAGDIIENIYSTSAQLGTNDLDLPAQVVEAAYAMQRGLQMLAPLTPSIRYAAVSSNHGAHRIGPKSPAGDAHSDYGLAVAKMLGHALELNPSAFGHVTVQTPEPFMESLHFQTSGTDIGLVHSHQASGGDKIGEWWKGQSHGNMPVAQARILVCGHWHSLRVQQSGDSRWIMVGPSSDRGSSWFTNLKGEQSESGMLSFTTANNAWNNLRVL
jgi:hypothetical protein